MAPVLPGFASSPCFPTAHHHGISARGVPVLSLQACRPSARLEVSASLTGGGEMPPQRASSVQAARRRVTSPAAALRVVVAAVWSRLTLTAVTLAFMLLGSIASLPSSVSARGSSAASPTPRLQVETEYETGSALQLLDSKSGPSVMVARADTKAEAKAKEIKAKQAKARMEARATEAKAKEAKAKEAKAKAEKAKEARDKAQAASKKAAKGSNVMLSMKTPEQKQKLIALVSGAYVLVWAFFYFTHDAGEVSE